MSNTCSSCRFWVRQSAKNAGQCHQQPPQASAELKMNHQWPVTRATDWCGQFTPALKESIVGKKQLLNG